jgi:hypothetical protein
MKIYEYTSTVLMTDTQITVRATINGNQEMDVVTRGGSEITDFKTACERQRQVALASSPTATSAPCLVFVGSRWVKAIGSGTIIGSATNVTVPASNSGGLILRVDSTGATVKYSIAGGAWTTFTDGTTITVTNGQSLNFEVVGLGSQESLFGTVEDSDTGQLVDRINFFNATP